MLKPTRSPVVAAKRSPSGWVWNSGLRAFRLEPRDVISETLVAYTESVLVGLHSRKARASSRMVRNTLRVLPQIGFMLKLHRFFKPSKTPYIRWQCGYLADVYQRVSVIYAFWLTLECVNVIEIYLWSVTLTWNC